MPHPVALAPRAPLPTPPPVLARAPLSPPPPALALARRCTDGLCALTTTTTLFYTPLPSTSTFCSTLTSSTWIENVWETHVQTSWSTTTVTPAPTPVETRTSVVYATSTSTVAAGRPCCPAARRREEGRWDGARVVAQQRGEGKQRRWEGDSIVTSTSTLFEEATTTAWASASPSSSCDMSCYASSSDGSSGSGAGAEQTQGSSTQAGQCASASGCGFAWLSLLFGAVPSKNGDFFASIVFFLAFTALFLIASYRLWHWAALDKHVFMNLLPLVLSTFMLLINMATRAYAANTSPSTSHLLTLQLLSFLAPPLLVDACLQLTGLLSRRAQPGGYLDLGAGVCRVLNGVGLLLFAVAGATQITFINNLERASASSACTQSSSLATLPFVADLLVLIALIFSLGLVILARLRSYLAGFIVLHLGVIHLFLLSATTVHLLHSVSAVQIAARGWAKWVPPSSAVQALASSCWNSTRRIDWAALRSIRGGADSPIAYWVFWALCLLLATLALLAVNLPAYTSSRPPPAAMPDSARYQLCYDTTSGAEGGGAAAFKRVDNPGAPTLPTGEPLYELVRGDDGEWHVRPATAPTVGGPGGAGSYATFTPWYR